MTHSKIGSRWCSAYSYTSYANPNTNCGSTSNSCNTSKFDSDRFRVTDNNWTSSPFKLFAFSDESNWSFDSIISSNGSSSLCSSNFKCSITYPNFSRLATFIGTNYSTIILAVTQFTSCNFINSTNW